MRGSSGPGPDPGRNRCASRILIDLAKQVANFDNSTFSSGTTSQRPGTWRGNLDRDLVRFQLDERLAARNCVPLVLEPAEDRRFDDRFTQRWDFYR